MAFKMNPALKAYGKSAGSNRVMQMNPSVMKNKDENKKKKSTVDKIKDTVVKIGTKADDFVDRTAKKVGSTKIPGTNTTLRDAASKADSFLEGNN